MLLPRTTVGAGVPARRAAGAPESADALPEDAPPDDPGPTPPVPKIPPRPLDWPPDAGVPVPDQPPAGSPA